METLSKKPNIIGNLFNQFIKYISSVFSPILGILAATGMLKGVLSLFVVLGWMSQKSGTYEILYAASDSVFYFLPVLLAFSAASYMKINQYTAVTIAATLLYPNITQLMSGNEMISFMGINIIHFNYSNSVIPILLVIWVASKLEPFLNKIIPSSISFIFTPLIVIVLLVPFTFMVIGPIGSMFGASISKTVMLIYKSAPWLAGLLVGGLWSTLVIFGIHWAFVPIFTNDLALYNSDPFIPMVTASVIAQAGAVLGVYLTTKNKSIKTISLPAMFSALLGITEPAVYGVTLKLKIPFIAASIAGAIGGAASGLMQARAYGMGVPSLLAIPTFIGKGFTGAVVGVSIGFFGALIITVVLGMINNKNTSIQNSPSKK